MTPAVIIHNNKALSRGGMIVNFLLNYFHPFIPCQVQARYKLQGVLAAVHTLRKQLIGQSGPVVDIFSAFMFSV
jgi:hypothetical protein